jgi:hypothetical protein
MMRAMNQAGAAEEIRREALIHLGVLVNIINEYVCVSMGTLVALLRNEPSIAVNMEVPGESLQLCVERLTSNTQHQLTLTHIARGPANAAPVMTDLSAVVFASDNELWTAFDDSNLIWRIENEPELYPDEISTHLRDRYPRFVRPTVLALIDAVYRAGELPELPTASNPQADSYTQ